MKLVYFASLRETIGTSAEELDVPETIKTLDDLIGWLSNKDERYRLAFANKEQVRAAIDQTHQPLDAEFKGAQEIAFFPPVTGG